MAKPGLLYFISKEFTRILWNYDIPRPCPRAVSDGARHKHACFSEQGEIKFSSVAYETDKKAAENFVTTSL